MTTPSNDDGADAPAAEAEEPVKLDKPETEPAFDPYRFGKPDHPVPPEYAPPGYVPDTAVAPTSSQPGSAEPAFDPYRFGKPDHPIPPQYAPPGYVPDQSAVPPPPGVYPSAPYGQAPYGQTPYGQQPYGSPYPPPPGGFQPGPAANRNNGKAVTAMVLGIASIVLCWLSFLALFVIVPALVFGIIGLNDAKTRGGNGRGMAIAGIACAVVAAVLATVLTIFVFRAADKCGGVENSNDPGFEQCVQENFFSRGEF